MFSIARNIINIALNFRELSIEKDLHFPKGVEFHLGEMVSLWFCVAFREHFISFVTLPLGITRTPNPPSAQFLAKWVVHVGPQFWPARAVSQDSAILGGAFWGQDASSLTVSSGYSSRIWCSCQTIAVCNTYQES